MKRIAEIEEELTPTELECARCGNIFYWEPTIWSYAPHVPKPLTCPKCESIEWKGG